MRAGLVGMLDTEDDLELVDEAGDGEEALARVAALAPDVVLMALRMPGTDGAAATARIVAERSSAKVLVLTTYDTDGDIVRAVEAGATGYLLKDHRGLSWSKQCAPPRGERRCWRRRWPGACSASCGRHPPRRSLRASWRCWRASYVA